MFWLLVFAAVALTLAWRGAPLTTATGVLGVTVLFYGWLGESTGRFLLLLLAWLAVFVPLNVPALRQEWLSRPWLARWRDQSPAVMPAHSTAASPLAAECLAAVLAERLRNPVAPHAPSPAAGAAILALYTVAARRHAGLDDDHAVHWQLARHTAVLRGCPPDASLHPYCAATTSAEALAQAVRQHPLHSTVAAAVAQSNPSERLHAFDDRIWRLCGHALQQATRALLDALRARLIPDEDDDPALQRARRRTRLARYRAALLLDALLLHPAESAALHAPLGQAFAALADAEACLGFHDAAARPSGERDTAVAACTAALARCEAALARTVRESHPRLLRALLGVLCFPAGARDTPPTQAAKNAAARAVLSEAALRQRLQKTLAAELPCAEALAALDTRISALAPMDATLRRLWQIQFTPAPTSDAERLAAATQLGVLSDAETAVLHDALAFAATLSASSAS